MKPFFNKKGPGSWNNKPAAGGRSWERDGRPAMHSATCGQCGVDCKVPFKPNGRKPVFCTDCFRGDEHFESRPQYAERPGRRERERFDAPPRPPQAAAGGNAEVVKQLRELNRKMDQLLVVIADFAKDLDEMEEGDEAEMYEVMEDEGEEEDLTDEELDNATITF